MSQLIIDLGKLKDFDSKSALDFFATKLMGFSSLNPITATAGGNQSNGFLLDANAINIVATVGTAADAVKLPPATGKAGLWVIVANTAAANSMQVYGSGTDTINGVATATGVAQAAGKLAIYVALTGTGTADTWMRFISA